MSILGRARQRFARIGMAHVAIDDYPSPRGSLWSEWRHRTFPDFFRLLLRIERETRVGVTRRMRSWYWRQILMSDCTSVGKGLKLGPRGIRVFKGQGSKLIIGDNVIMYTPCMFVLPTHIFPESLTEIGDGTHIGRNCAIRAAKEIRIGKNCLIAHWVRIFDYNGHPIQPGDGRAGAPTPQDEVSPILIGDNVWIGDNAFIQRGVTIGNNSIVSGNSVVVKDVPENTVVMGNPARVILWLDKDKDKTGK